jgi:transcriptional regulator with XRE-family HTH domain
MDLKKKVGERIRFLRKLRGFTQEALAEKAEISVTFIGLTERGKNIPSITTLDRIATALSVKLSEMLDFEPPVGNKSKNLKELAIYLEASSEGQVGW